MKDVITRINLPEKIILTMIIIGAAILRFYNLGSMSLSNDELSALTRVQYDSFSEMISKGVYIDFHPAGLQSFLFYWVKIFGDDVFILRFPFVVCGLASIYLIYKIGKSWYNELTAFLAAASFSFLIFTILYNQLARMYSPGIMFCLLAVYYWTMFIDSEKGKSKNRAWFIWVISMSAAIHLHYFSFLFVGIVGISGLFFVKRDDLFKYSLGGLLSVLTFIPEIPIFIAQMKTGDIGGWLGPPSKTFLWDFIFELFNRSVPICSIVLFFIVWGMISTQRKKGQNLWRGLSIIWFVITFAVGYLYSVYRHPILMFSTMLFTTPFFLLLIFSFVPNSLLEKNRLYVTVILFSVVLIFDTIVPGRYFTEKHFGVFKEIAEDAHNWGNKYGIVNTSVVVNVINPAYINYYFDKMKESPKVVAYKIETPKDYSKLINLVSSSTSTYFVYIWSNSIHPFEVPGIIRGYYPYLIEKKNYFNAEAYLFGKRQSSREEKTLLFSTTCDYEETDSDVNLGNVSSEQYFSGRRSGKLDGEFSTALRDRISKIPGSDYRYVSFTAWVYPVENDTNAKMVLSFDRNNKPFDYHAVLLSDFNLRKNKWQQIIIAAELPAANGNEDVFSAYFWNPSAKLFYIDDMKVEVHSGDNPYERLTR